MADSRLSRSDRVLALSSGCILPRGADPVLEPRPLVVDPVIDWYLPRSASLRLCGGRPLPVSAGRLFVAGVPWLCVGKDSSAVLPDDRALLRRNTGIA